MAITALGTVTQNKMEMVDDIGDKAVILTYDLSEADAQTFAKAISQSTVNAYINNNKTFLTGDSAGTGSNERTANWVVQTTQNLVVTNKVIRTPNPHSGDVSEKLGGGFQITPDKASYQAMAAFVGAHYHDKETTAGVWHLVSCDVTK